MAKGKKRPRDINRLALSIVDEAVGDEAKLQPDDKPDLDGKNPNAVALGRLGGKKGGRARAESLSAERRSEIARRAAQARWAKEKKGKRNDGS